MINLILLGIFTGIKTWWAEILSGGVFVVAAFILKKSGLAAIVDKVAKIGAKYSGYIRVVAEGSEDTFKLIDKAIADDNTVDANTLKEALESGKKVKATVNDIVIEIKKK